MLKKKNTLAIGWVLNLESGAMWISPSQARLPLRFSDDEPSSTLTFHASAPGCQTSVSRPHHFFLKKKATRYSPKMVCSGIKNLDYAEPHRVVTSRAAKQRVFRPRRSSRCFAASPRPGNWRPAYNQCMKPAWGWVGFWVWSWIWISNLKIQHCALLLEHSSWVELSWVDSQAPRHNVQKRTKHWSDSRPWLAWKLFGSRRRAITRLQSLCVRQCMETEWPGVSTRNSVIRPAGRTAPKLRFHLRFKGVFVRPYYPKQSVGLDLNSGPSMFRMGN